MTDLSDVIRAELLRGYWMLSRQTSSAAEKGARVVEALLDLHQPFKVHGDCGHDHGSGQDGVTERFDGLLVCDAADTTTVCIHCCTADFGQTDACASSHEHDSSGPCKTVRAIAEQLGLLAEVDHDGIG